MPSKKRNEYGLTLLQERFCEEYLIDLNGTRAYIRAGYSAKPDIAKVAACNLLTKPEIQDRISQLMEERSKRTQIKADNVLQEIPRLAFHNIENYCDWDEDGNLFITPGKEIPRQLKAAIKKINKRTKKIPVKNGEPIEITTLEL